jgi:hypothetical protein
VSVFPNFIDQEVNESLMEEITKEELWSTLQSFQKDKSLGLDVLTIEFNTRCFDILGEDLLRVVEYSRTWTYSSTIQCHFLSSYAKTNNPQYFD